MRKYFLFLWLLIAASVHAQVVIGDGSVSDVYGQRTVGSNIDFSPPVDPVAISTETDGVNEYVSYGGSVLNATNGTISAWVKILARGNSDATIIGDAGSWWHFHQFGTGTSSYAWSVYNGGYRTTSPVTLNLDQWYHIACTWNTGGSGNTQLLYVNGVLLGSTTWKLAIGNVTGDTRSGGQGVAGYNMNVRINQWETWSRQLTDVEVLELYNTGYPMNPALHSAAANLTHAWRSGNGDTYPIILDHVGSKNGTMINMEAGDFVTDTP